MRGHQARKQVSYMNQTKNTIALQQSLKPSTDLLSSSTQPNEPQDYVKKYQSDKSKTPMANVDKNISQETLAQQRSR
jgi:hypothetical protein